MEQTRRPVPTEQPPAMQPPTFLNPDEQTRLRRLFFGMPYMTFIPTQLDPDRHTTVEDVIHLVKLLQDNVVAAATRAERTEAELHDLRSTVRGGARFLALLRDMEAGS